MPAPILNPVLLRGVFHFRIPNIICQDDTKEHLLLEEPARFGYAPSLRCCDAAMLRCCDAAMLRCCDAAMLRCCDAAMMLFYVV